MMTLTNLEPVVLDLRSNLHLAAILPLNRGQGKETVNSVFYDLLTLCTLSL